MQTTSWRKCAALAAELMMLCAAVLAGEDFSQYAHKACIAFSGYEGETTLTNFPALVKIAEGVGGFSYADCAQANGVDVRFSLGNVELASEVVTWNPNGTSEFWVKVPELSQTAVVYMHWGNADAGARDQRQSVWDGAYSAVWNMDNTGPALIDVSGNSNHGSAKATSASGAGVVGNARVFSSANSDYARAGHGYDDSFSSSSFTYEGWFKTAANPSSQLELFGYSVQDGNYNTAAIQRDIQLSAAGKPVFVMKGTSYAAEGDAAAPDVWHHVAVTYDKATKTVVLYLDGAAVKTGSFTATENACQPMNRFQFANANYINQKKYFDGSLDEIRISRAARSADYVAAVYKNLAANGDFLSLEDMTGSAIPSVDPPPVRTFTIDVSAEAGGNVSPSGAISVEEGRFLEVTASYPTADRAFYAWDGDCPTTQVFSATIRIPADRDRALVARFGKVYAIEPEEGVDVIKNGLDQIAADAATDPSVLPAVLALGQGTYTLVNPYVKKGYGFTISSPIAVRSADGVGKAVLDFGNVQGRAAFNLKSMGAVIDGLTFINGSEKSAYNGNSIVALVEQGHLLNCTVDGYSERSDDDSCITVKAGWVSRCRFLNAKSAQTGTRSFPIDMGGGTLFDSCVVSNFCGSQATMRLGGVARNSLFASCAARHVSSGYGGAIQFANTDGKTSGGFGITAYAENCTFVDCSAVYGGAVAYKLGGILPVAVNCAFLGNAVGNAAQEHDAYGVALVNCVSKNAEATDGNIVSEPVFTDGVCTPAANSPTRDAGRFVRWAAAPGATDLAGSNRLEEAAVDVGCREFPKPAREPLSVGVTASAYEGRDMLSAAFTATVHGDRTGLTYAWDFGDGGTSADAAPAHTFAAAGYYTVTLTVQNLAGETAAYSGTDIIKVYPSTCYVRAEGESTPAEPYATPETAANALADALRVGPSRIDIGEGSIPIGREIRLNYAVSVIGAGAEKTCLTAGTCEADTSNIYVEHEDAVLTGIRVDTVNCSWGTMMTLSNGIISNCVFRKCSSNNTGTMFLRGGRLVDCVFDQCNSPYRGIGGVLVTGSDAEIDRCVFSGLSGHCSGVAVLVQNTTAPGPSIRNCLFEGNKGSVADITAALYCSSPAVIENCTLTGNKMEYGAKAGGLYLAADGIEVCNTIIWDNTVHATNVVDNMDGTSVTNLEWVTSDFAVAAGKSVSVSNSCAPELAGVATCVAADPLFNLGTKPKLPHYAILGNSPCVNAGVKLGWMTESATDLIGNRRAVGLPDIGCYENQTFGLMIWIQ